MNRLNKIATQVIDYYGENPPVASQIMHTQSVAHFTHLISCGENLDSEKTELLEIAAWLHDIGCPPAMAKYGNSTPPHQEAEGKILVHQWLDNNDYFTETETKYLADVVGGHHRLSEALRLDFMPLFEADIIVNLFEGYYKSDMLPKFINSGAISTQTSLALAKKLF